MERSRHGEGHHEHMSQPLPPVDKWDQHLTTEPPVLEASGEDAAERENLEPPTLPGYLTLELDVSDLQAFMPDADAASTQPDWEMDGSQAPEESTPPGYLTLEIDLNALEDGAPWRASHNAISDEPRRKV
jgi:hypothetical protein